MTEEDGATSSGAITVLGVVALILRRWLWLAIGMVAVAALLVTPKLLADPQYTASVSFIPQVAESGPSGLARLAGELGVALPTAGAGKDGPYYADLVTRRSVLGSVVAEPVPGPDGRAEFADLFQVGGSTPELREELALERLRRQVLTVQVARTTGIVTVRAVSRWPETSRAIVTRVLAALDSVGNEVQRRQATAERTFHEARIEEGRSALRQAEQGLEQFLRANRVFRDSPELVSEHGRLERAILIQQQVLTALMQGYEEARLREARNTPLFTVLEGPTLPVVPDARGRLRTIAIGMIIGALLAGFAILAEHRFSQLLAEGDPDALALSRRLRFRRPRTNPIA